MFIVLSWLGLSCNSLSANLSFASSRRRVIAPDFSLFVLLLRNRCTLCIYCRIINHTECAINVILSFSYLVNIWYLFFFTFLCALVFISIRRQQFTSLSGFSASIQLFAWIFFFLFHFWIFDSFFCSSRNVSLSLLFLSFYSSVCDFAIAFFEASHGANKKKKEECDGGGDGGWGDDRERNKNVNNQSCNTRTRENQCMDVTVWLYCARVNYGLDNNTNKTNSNNNKNPTNFPEHIFIFISCFCFRFRERVTFFPGDNAAAAAAAVAVRLCFCCECVCVLLVRCSIYVKCEPILA